MSYLTHVHSGILSFAASIAICALTGCSSSSGSHNSSAASSVVVTPTSDTAGVVTAAIDPNSAATQVVNASSSSSINGTSVSFAPGSLALATNVTVQAGATLASAVTGQDLGTTGTLTAASSAVVVQSSVAADAISPFKINLALSSGSSLLGSTTKTVIYRVTKGSDATTIYTGVLPASALTISGNTAVISTIWFGVYQVVTSTVDISAVTATKTSQPIVTEAEALPSALTATWKQACKNDCPMGVEFYCTETVTINGSSWVDVIEQFFDSTCTEEPIISQTSYMTAVLDATATQVPSGESGMNFVLAKLVATPESIFAASLLNSRTYNNIIGECGITDWESNASRDITGINCDGGNPPPASYIYQAGQIFYGAVGTGSTLSIAVGGTNKSCGDTAANRCTTLNTTATWVKQ